MDEESGEWEALAGRRLPFESTLLEREADSGTETRRTMAPARATRPRSLGDRFIPVREEWRGGVMMERTDTARLRFALLQDAEERSRTPLEHDAARSPTAGRSASGNSLGRSGRSPGILSTTGDIATATVAQSGVAASPAQQRWRRRMSLPSTHLSASLMGADGVDSSADAAASAARLEWSDVLGADPPPPASWPAAAPGTESATTSPSRPRGGTSPIQQGAGGTVAASRTAHADMEALLAVLEAEEARWERLAERSDPDIQERVQTFVRRRRITQRRRLELLRVLAQHQREPEARSVTGGGTAWPHERLGEVMALLRTAACLGDEVDDPSVAEEAVEMLVAPNSSFVSYGEEASGGRDHGALSTPPARAAQHRRGRGSDDAAAYAHALESTDDGDDTADRPDLVGVVTATAAEAGRSAQRASPPGALTAAILNARLPVHAQHAAMVAAARAAAEANGTSPTNAVTAAATANQGQALSHPLSTYSVVLENELLSDAVASRSGAGGGGGGGGGESFSPRTGGANHNASYTSAAPPSPSRTPSPPPRRSLLDFSGVGSADGDDSHHRTRAVSDSPSSIATSSSPTPLHTSPVRVSDPLVARSLGLGTRRAQRRISRVPFKVLDAPSLADDFYLNLVDWSTRNVLAVGLGNSVYLWSAYTSKVSKLCDMESAANAVCSVSWSARGDSLAVGLASGLVHVYDAETGTLSRALSGHTARAGCLAWSPTLLCSGSRDRTICQRDLRAPSQSVSVLEAHRQEVCGLRWSCDYAQLASGGNDNKLLVWNLHASRPCWQFGDHEAAVKAIAWSPHQHGLLASGGGTADRCIRFWNTATGAALHAVDTGSQVCNLAWSKTLNELVSTHGYSQNQIVLWRYPSMSKVATLTGHLLRVLYLAMSPDGAVVVTGAGDETLRFWNVFPVPRPAHGSRGGPIGGRYGSHPLVAGRMAAVSGGGGAGGAISVAAADAESAEASHGVVLEGYADGALPVTTHCSLIR